MWCYEPRMPSRLVSSVAKGMMMVERIVGKQDRCKTKLEGKEKECMWKIYIYIYTCSLVDLTLEIGENGPRLLLSKVMLLQPHDQDSVCANFKVPRYDDRPTNPPTLGSAPPFSRAVDLASSLRGKYMHQPTRHLAISKKETPMVRMA